MPVITTERTDDNNSTTNRYPLDRSPRPIYAPSPSLALSKLNEPVALESDAEEAVGLGERGELALDTTSQVDAEDIVSASDISESASGLVSRPRCASRFAFEVETAG